MAAKKSKPTSDDLKKALALSIIPGFSVGMQPNFPAQIRLASREPQPLPVPPKMKRKGK
jgi:hypothetical protein